MLILGLGATLAVTFGAIYVIGRRQARTDANRLSLPQPPSAALGTTLVAILVATSLLLGGGISNAAIVPTITMGTADDYSVLAGTTVTNTGLSVLEQNLGVSPGTAVTGFPPGVVTPPATIESNTATAVAAQLDLAAAYDEAAARPLNATIAAELGGQTLLGGVYAAPASVALALTGNLILDGSGDPNSVFIFQTDFALNTAAASTITLINRAQACNVFWQVGSSATLGASSTFVGNILAFTAITVGAGVVVEGRALARNAAVTLDSDTFSTPGCDLSVPTTTTAPTTTTTTLPTTTTTAPTTTTTTAPTTTTTAPTTTTTAPTTTTTTASTTTTTATTTLPIPTTSTTLEVAPTTLQATTTSAEATSTSAEIGGGAESSLPGDLPYTGSGSTPAVIVALLALVAGIVMVRASRTSGE